MLINEYQTKAQRTSPAGHDRIDNALLGLIGETGEIVDIYKKWKYQSVPGTQLPREKVLEELGDVLWYLAELAAGMNLMFSEIARGGFVDYDDKVRRRSNRKQDLRRVVLGISAQAAEIREHADRKRFDRVEASTRKMIAGMATLAYMCGSTLQDTAAENIKKLENRYPAGFDAMISMSRYR